MRSLTKGDVTIELEDIGEGWDGDYDPDDPEDERLLRFTVLKGDEQVQDGSYCTQLPATLSDGHQDMVLQILMSNLWNIGPSFKRRAESLSWLSVEDLIS